MLRTKYKNKVDLMPKYDQIVNHIRYRREQGGNSKNLDQVKEFVKKKRYNPVTCEDDTMFCFGERLGTGTDNDHFQLGFTSVLLLMRLLWSGMFHIDATYKIIKYFYQLIIFGITDLNRCFFPIAFMVTSHEKTGDYIHFFKSLNKIASQLVPGPREDFQFKFEPKNIVSDAAKSIAKAIKRTYPSCSRSRLGTKAFKITHK